jgi:hypothetical protein
MTRYAALLRSLLAVPLLLLPAWAGAWYIGAGLGQTNTEYVPTFNPVNSSIEDSDTAYKIFVGQQLGPNFAVELEYADLNDLVRHTGPGVNLQMQGSSLAASVLGRLPVYTGWSMFGRLGFGLWDSDLDVIGASGSKTGFAPVIGLGIEYSGFVTGASRIGLGVEWQQYQNIGEDTSASTTRLTGQNVDVFWLRFTYHFQLAPGQ